MDAVHYSTSGNADMTGHRRPPVLMFASLTSIPPGPLHRATSTVGTVFSCVASRKRCRDIYDLPCPRRAPYPLGKNQSLSSPPLEPRGLLLSVMRQKVGKERSQEGCAPLAIPRQPPPGECSALRPPPPRRSAPGRQGRATLRVVKSSARNSAPFFRTLPSQRDRRPTLPLASTEKLFRHYPTAPHKH